MIKIRKDMPEENKPLIEIFLEEDSGGVTVKGRDGFFEYSLIRFVPEGIYLFSSVGTDAIATDKDGRIKVIK